MARPAPARSPSGSGASRPAAARSGPKASRPAPAPARIRSGASRPAPASARTAAAAAPRTARIDPAVKPAPAKSAPSKPAARLKVVPEARSRRSASSFGTFAALLLFMALLGLAGLHAVLVQNQAELDDLVSANRARQERVDDLQGRIAILDSPAGVAEQAVGAGLVLAPEVVTLSPVAAGVLGLPGPDPFGLIEAGLWARPPRQSG